jgi:hypothetical protein
MVMPYADTVLRCDPVIIILGVCVKAEDGAVLTGRGANGS